MIIHNPGGIGTRSTPRVRAVRSVGTCTTTNRNIDWVNEPLTIFPGAVAIDITKHREHLA